MQRRKIAAQHRRSDSTDFGYRIVGEASYKTLIGRRLKQSGMFCSLLGANAIIAARCCHLSHRAEQFREDRATA